MRRLQAGGEILNSSLGLESKTVRVVDYDDAWPALFIAEVTHLRPFCPSLAFEHVGSTAVPGLCAKPVLDILAGHPTGSVRARVRERTANRLGMSIAVTPALPIISSSAAVSRAPTTSISWNTAGRCGAGTLDFGTICAPIRLRHSAMPS